MNYLQILYISIPYEDMKRCGLHVRPEWDKARRDGFQPLPKPLTEEIKTFAEEGKPSRLYREVYQQSGHSRDGMFNDPLLYVPHIMSRPFDRDLKDANVPKWTPEGKADFHGLRTSFVTLAIEAGGNPKEVQSLARHGSLSMTMDVYARARTDRLDSLVGSLGELVGASEWTHSGRTLAAVGCNSGDLPELVRCRSGDLNPDVLADTWS